MQDYQVYNFAANGINLAFLIMVIIHHPLSSLANFKIFFELKINKQKAIIQLLDAFIEGSGLSLILAPPVAVLLQLLSKTLLYLIPYKYNIYFVIIQI